MFKILQKTLAHRNRRRCRIRTPLPSSPITFAAGPEFDFAKWIDARPAAEVCPTGAIAVEDQDDLRHVTIDYGLCIFCGQCAEASPEAVTVTRQFEMATRLRRNLVIEAEYSLEADGTHHSLLGGAGRTGRHRFSGSHPQDPGPLAGDPPGGRRLVQRLRAGNRRAQQSDPRHRTVRHPLRRLAAPRRSSAGHRTGHAQHGTGAAEDVRGDAGSQGRGGGRRMRHQRRHLRHQLRHSRRRRYRGARGRVCAWAVRRVPKRCCSESCSRPAGSPRNHNARPSSQRG